MLHSFSILKIRLSIRVRGQHLLKIELSVLTEEEKTLVYLMKKKESTEKVALLTV